MKPDIFSCLTCGVEIKQTTGPGRIKKYCCPNHRNPGAYARAVAKSFCATCKGSKEDGDKRRCRACQEKFSKNDRKLRRLREYGLRVMEVADGYCCPICNEPISMEKGHIDHDHGHCPGPSSCGLCVRQLTCRSCNILLGHAKDNPLILRQAATYIEKHKDLLSARLAVYS